MANSNEQQARIKSAIGTITLTEAIRRLSDPAAAFRNPVVPGFIPSRGLTVLYGASGTGKTFAALDVALRVAGGLPWGSRPLRHGLVVVIAAEDPEGVMVRAVAAAQSLDALDAPIRITRPPCPVTDGSFGGIVSAVIRELAEETGLEPALVILDTLGAAFGGASQDDAGPMTMATGQLLQIAEQCGCGVVALHHTSKGGDRMRGSQVLHDRADAVIRLSRSAGSVRGEVEKARNGPTKGGFTFQLGAVDLELAGAEPIRTCVVQNLVVDADSAGRTDARPKRLSRDAQTALDELRRLTLNGEAVPEDIWRSAVTIAFGERKPGALRQALSNARTILMERGMALFSEGFVSVSEPSADRQQPNSADASITCQPSVSARPPLKRGRADADADGPIGGMSDESEKKPRSARLIAFPAAGASHGR
ncbi:helicase RepA family protein [Methylobacterium currus]|uniref:AAA family ATPase n=1 Tax=Methylobacterium currus TaxID=2051553 RepID=UPI001E5BD7F2|nr:AAA family ATPase [Methylobacterium currus]UHC14440.1 helicase RepA family protein [Methylobacterium currus]